MTCLLCVAGVHDTPPGCMSACFVLLQITSYKTSIASLAFSYDGGMLAVASSYMFEHGDQKEHQQDQIFMRPMQEAEVKPKPRKVA